ncbi:MAG: hypothetical protein DSY95_03110, partial [SAR324 cluster bacterium]
SKITLAPSGTVYSVQNFTKTYKAISDEAPEYLCDLGPSDGHPELSNHPIVTEIMEVYLEERKKRSSRSSRGRGRSSRG